MLKRHHGNLKPTQTELLGIFCPRTLTKGELEYDEIKAIFQKFGIKPARPDRNILINVSIGFRILLIHLLSASDLSCAPKKAMLPRPPLTDLQKKFETKCRKDYNLNVITRIVGKTFWIYAPTDKPLFDFAAESPSPPDPLKKPAKYDLLYINGSFKNNTFNFEYDVIPKIKSDMQTKASATKARIISINFIIIYLPLSLKPCWTPRPPSLLW